MRSFMSNQADHTIAKLRVPPELKENLKKLSKKINAHKVRKWSLDLRKVLQVFKTSNRKKFIGI